MHYLIHAMEIDTCWVSGPSLQAEILMMSTDIKELKKEIKSIFNEKCKGKDSEADDYEYTRGFKYLTYFVYEHTGPTRHHFIICNEPNVKAIK